MKAGDVRNKGAQAAYESQRTLCPYIVAGISLTSRINITSGSVAEVSKTLMVFVCAGLSLF